MVLSSKFRFSIIVTLKSQWMDVTNMLWVLMFNLQICLVMISKTELFLSNSNLNLIAKWMVPSNYTIFSWCKSYVLIPLSQNKHVLSWDLSFFLCVVLVVQKNLEVGEVLSVDVSSIVALSTTINVQVKYNGPMRRVVFGVLCFYICLLLSLFLSCSSLSGLNWNMYATLLVFISI